MKKQTWSKVLKHPAVGILGGIALALPVAAIAGTVTLPNTFTAGEVISASEVNANFAAVKTAVDDNHGRISALEGNGVLDDCTWAVATANDVGSLDVTCPANTYAISGGCANNNAGIPLRVSRPNGSSNGAAVTAVTEWHCTWDGAASTSSAYAVCCAL